MIYTIDAEVAREYGVNEAIMIASLKFWIAKNKANGTNYFEGRYWTYNSIKAFIELFPFWSVQNIKTILKHLKEKGVIISGNFNTNKYDQTLWYAFVDEEKWIGENKKFEKLELTNRKCGTNQPIPDIIPDIKENNIINNITKEKEENDQLTKENKQEPLPAKQTRFKKPTLEEVEEYIHEKGLSVDARKFYDYFNEGDWVDSAGKKVKNWKQKLITWDGRGQSKRIVYEKPKALSKAQEIDRRNMEYLKEMLGGVEC